MAKLKENKLKCAEKAGISPEMLDGASKGKFPNDPKLKASLVCMEMTIGFIDQSGQFQHDTIKAVTGQVLGDQGLADQIDAECAVPKSSLEETIYEHLKCLYAKSGKPNLIEW